MNEHHIRIPIITQDNKVAGWSEIELSDLLQVEGHIDDQGNVWTPPTAWAYMQACNLRHEVLEENRAMRELLENIRNRARDNAYGSDHIICHTCADIHRMIDGYLEENPG